MGYLDALRSLIKEPHPPSRHQYFSNPVPLYPSFDSTVTLKNNLKNIHFHIKKWQKIAKNAKSPKKNKNFNILTSKAPPR